MKRERDREKFCSAPHLDDARHMNLWRHRGIAVTNVS